MAERTYVNGGTAELICGDVDQDAVVQQERMADACVTADDDLPRSELVAAIDASHAASKARKLSKTASYKANDVGNVVEF